MCYGSEDCYATFEHELFQAVSPARCENWHSYVHQNYTESGPITGGTNCQDQIIVDVTCQCGQHSYTRYTGEYGSHSWDSWGAISGVNKHSRSCLICQAYEEGSCVMAEFSVSYSAAPTMTNKHWVNGTCEECGRPMQYSDGPKLARRCIRSSIISQP